MFHAQEYPYSAVSIWCSREGYIEGDTYVHKITFGQCQGTALHSLSVVQQPSNLKLFRH